MQGLFIFSHENQYIMFIMFVIKIVYARTLLYHTLYQLNIHEILSHS